MHGAADEVMSGDASFVPMVQAADFAECDHVTLGGALHASGRRRIFRQREMSPRSVIVRKIAGCRRVLRDVEVNDPPAVMENDDEDEQDSTRDGRDGEEIHRAQRRDVIRQERAPCLRRRPTRPPHKPGDSSLRDLNTQLAQLAAFTEELTRAMEKPRSALIELRPLTSAPFQSASSWVSWCTRW